MAGVNQGGDKLSRVGNMLYVEGGGVTQVYRFFRTILAILIRSMHFTVHYLQLMK